jgi:general secretion pathway protein I
VRCASSRGFTLVEVLVALMIVAIGLSALMMAVSGAARASGYLRDKTQAQWIALNRLTEVRLTTNRLGDTHDTGQLDFANRTWHYDTRYFDTSFTSMKRIVVRVWAGDAKTKSNPIAEATGFIGADLSTPGSSNIDWTVGSTMSSVAQGATGTAATTPTGTQTNPTTTAPNSGTPGSGGTTTPVQQPSPQ